MNNQNKKIVGTIILLILLSLGSIVFYACENKSNFNEKVLVDNKALKEEKSEIKVSINGEIKNPGVYSLNINSRIEDLIKVAGGYNIEADRLKVNEAKKLKDEDSIIIPKKGNNAVGSSTAGSVSDDGKININTATKEELMKLPRIGETTAVRIIEYREKNGLFKSISDLKKVGRIGDKTIENIKEKISID